MSTIHEELLAELESDGISSATSEVKRRRSQKKTTIPKIAPPKPKVAIIPSTDLSSYIQTASIEDPPIIGTFAEMSTIHPHLNDPSIPINKSKTNKAPKTKVSQLDQQFDALSKTLKDVDNSIGGNQNNTMKHKFQSDARPISIQLYEQKLNKVTSAHYYQQDLQLGTLTDKQYSDALRRKQLYLPISLAAHESNILKEGGRFSHSGGRIYDFPLCLNGSNCVGMTSPFRNKPRPFIFMSYMRQEQYEHFLATDEIPPQMACLACLRTSFADFITYHRSMKNQPDCITAFEAIHDTDIIHQLYINLVDCEGGYHKSHMIQCQLTDPMLEAVARLQCSYTYVTPDLWDRNRLSLNQDALIWASKPALIPRVGERKYTPHDACLQEYGILNGSEVDRARCEELMHDILVPKEVQLAAAYIGDALRHLPDDPDYRYADISQCRISGVLNHILLENIHSDVQNLSFYSALSDNKDSLRYLLSKVIPQRCQQRKNLSVIRQRTRFTEKELTQIAGQKDHKLTMKQLRKQATFPRVLSILRQLTLNSLLGYYPHSNPKTRPQLSKRAELYKLFDDEKWFDELICNDSHILEYVIRDYLVYALPDNQGLFNHIKTLFDFDTWSKITQTAMEKIRPLFNRTFDWILPLKKPLDLCHTALLTIPYHRVNQTVRQQLKSARKKIHMIARPGMDASTFEEPTEEEPEQLEEKAEDVLNLQTYVSDIHYQILVQCLRTVGPRRLGCIQRVLAVLDEGFGLSQEIIQLLITLCDAHQQPGATSTRVREHLTILATRQPHAYNILQTLASIQEELLRVRVVEDLPVSYMKYQLQAIQETFGVSTVLDKCLYFVFCPICDQIYSIVRDFHSVYKASYDYGYRDCITDMQTKEIYCGRGKTNHRGTCGKLSKIFLLGKTLRYENKLIMICPQKNCGLMMSLDTNLANHNERGWACCKCSVKKEVEEVVKKSCLLCGPGEIKEGFHYPHGLYLCKKHHNNVFKLPKDEIRGTKNTQELTDMIVKHRTEMKIQAIAKAAAYARKGRL